MFKKFIAVTAMVAMGIGSSSAFTADQLAGANELAGKGVINAGSSAADFGLDNTITRKEIMKIVLNLSGKNVTDACNGDFGDVESDWGCKYIEAGLRNGFIAANASFRPNDSISKAEAMKLILGARGISKAYNTSDWQADWMNTAYDNSLIDAKYSDHNTSATRGWIFAIGAADQATRTSSVPTPVVEEEETSIDDDLDSIFEGILGDDTSTVIQEEAPATPVATSGKTGFFDYDTSLIGENDTTVLFFHASWCPTCRSAESNIHSTGVDDFLILKVDFDNSSDLRKKYRVTTKHTFVQIDSDGEFVKSWQGSSSAADIRSKLK